MLNVSYQKKMLNIISNNFLVNLKSHNIPKSKMIVVNIQVYIEDKKFIQVIEIPSKRD